MSGSARRPGIVLLPLALAAGCVVVESDAERDTPRSSDTAAGEVSALDQHSINTLIALGTSEAVDALAVPPAPDTVAVTPTAEDLALLRAELAMPLEGIAPADIPDTFSEPRGTRTHLAIDIPAPRGTPVHSAAPGRVMRLFSSEAGGLMVYAADSSERFVLMYAHLDAYAPGLADGAPLGRGDVIGFVGTTGNAPPNVPHLHFAIARTNDVTRWWTGTPVDPRPLLQP